MENSEENYFGDESSIENFDYNEEEEEDNNNYNEEEEEDWRFEYLFRMPIFLSKILLLNEEELKEYYKVNNDEDIKPLSYEKYLEILVSIIPINIIIEKNLIKKEDIDFYKTISLNLYEEKISKDVLEEIKKIDPNKVLYYLNYLKTKEKEKLKIKSNKYIIKNDSKNGIVNCKRIIEFENKPMEISDFFYD